VNLSLNVFSVFLPIWTLLVLGFMMAFAITWFTIPSIVTIARMKNLCSEPNSRTSHIAVTPSLGGIAIFIGFVLSTVIFAGDFFHFELKYIIAGSIVVFFIGIKDDILVIAPMKKLAGQIFAAGMVAVLANIRITSLYGLFYIKELPYMASIFLTIFVFIVIINGFNLIDGIDGLASGVGMITASVLGIWFWVSGNQGYTILSFSFVGTLAAFFYFNVFDKKNKIFLGDTGSLVTGFVISILACRFLQLQLVADGLAGIESAPAVIFGVLVIPLFDSLRVFILRIKDGRSPFKADRQHMHHHLLGLGCTHLQATLVLISVNLFFIGLSFYFDRIGIIWLMVVILGTASVMARLLVRLAMRQRRKKMDSVLELYFIVKTLKKRKSAQETVEKNVRRLPVLHSMPKARVMA
jgi:UDP-GlcNAc:undecaprenyl-phosphate GlcNAc-1-phosphate transferase